MDESHGVDRRRNVDIDEVRDMRDQLNRAMVDMRDQILMVVHTGFKGTHHRQDITNGRVGEVEKAAGRLDERMDATDDRLVKVERDNDAFHQHRRVTDPQPPPPAPPKSPKDADSRRITGWDVRVYVLGAATAVGFVKLLPWLVSLAQTGKP